MQDYRIRIVEPHEIEYLWDLFSPSNINVNYTRSFHNWARHYYNEFGSCKDISRIITYNNQIIGFWPLFEIVQNGIHSITYYANRIYEPIIVEEFRVQVESSLSSLFEQIILIGRQDPLFEIQIQTYGIFRIFENYLEKNFSSRQVQLSFCDLSLELEQIWQSTRKSYKALIHREEKVISVSFDDCTNFVSIDDYMKLHISASGRTVRSIENWKIQGQAISNGEAILCNLRDLNGKLVGGSYCNVSGKLAIYSSGAYDRSLEEEGRALGHLAQWAIIKYLKNNLGVKKYLLDVGNFSKIQSEKELSILHFKKGFARQSQECKIYSLNSYL